MAMGPDQNRKTKKAIVPMVLLNKLCAMGCFLQTSATLAGHRPDAAK